MTEPTSPWDRRPGESARAYQWFRRYRDLGPLRSFDALAGEEVRRTTLTEWSRRHDWRDRAEAWDVETHRADDARRLESIRTMHDQHQRAGRAVFRKALAALSAAPAEEIPTYVAARLLELGARLERDTLLTSVEELQGIVPPPAEDPWEAVARELEGVPDS